MTRSASGVGATHIPPPYSFFGHPTMKQNVAHCDAAVAAAFARTHRPGDFVDGLLTARKPDLAPEFAPTRDWLAAGAADRRAFAERVLRHVADVCPRMLTAPAGNVARETYAPL